MTNKEAAYILSDRCHEYSCAELRVAFDLAIKALEGTQGVWIRDEDTGLIGCSHCHIVWLRGNTTAYCPNCGAKMK